MSSKNKIRALSLISLYPLISTFLMTLIWQISQQYLTPFLGGYYFKWVFLYTDNNPDWLKEPYLPLTRILYSIYIGAYLLLVLLAVLILFRRRGKALCSWCVCGLWLVDCGWIVWDITMSGIQWQLFFLLGEHLIFIVLTLYLSFLYLRVKKTAPELFHAKKHRNNVYRKRFQ